uniref:Mucin-5AC-like n=1 Tax=Ascaris lumbricoides TaxID=6252 RepID=A0A0M3HQ81_ASCLU
MPEVLIRLMPQCSNFSSGDQQEATTAPGWQHQKTSKIANEEQLAAVILKTATVADYSAPPSATKFAVPLQAEAALPSLETSAPMLTASTTTKSTVPAVSNVVSTSTTTASTRTTTTTVPSTAATTSTSTIETTTPSKTITSHPRTATYRIPSTTVSTTTTTTTTEHPNTSSETENNELPVDDTGDENSLAEPRIAHVAVPIAIEKIGEGYDGTLNRRAKAPLTDGWEMIAPGTSAGSGRGAPSPTRIYAQSVPKTVLDKTTVLPRQPFGVMHGPA